MVVAVFDYLEWALINCPILTDMAESSGIQASQDDPVQTKAIPAAEGDIALQFAGEVTDVSVDLINRVRWKIDLCILPLLA